MIKKYKGYDYINYMHVVGGEREGGFMKHRNAYIRIPETHPLYTDHLKKKWFDIGLATWKMQKWLAKDKGLPFNVPKPKSRRYYSNDYDYLQEIINCHGGLSFTEIITERQAKEASKMGWGQGFTPGLWIGWDYGHAGDEMYDPTDNFAELKEKCLPIWKIHTHNGTSAGLGLFGRPDHWWLEPEVDKEIHAVIRQLIVLE